MKHLLKILLTGLVLLILFNGCGKDIVGPTTDRPDKPPLPEDSSAALVIYSSWAGNVNTCDSIEVLVNGVFKGYIRHFWDETPPCNDPVMTVIVDSLIAGSYFIQLGKNCEPNGMYWEMNQVVTWRQCLKVPVGK